jgi:hypothetical protein
MPRVAHWIQNGSVDHYPTHIVRQIYLAPWAEFAITQFQVLSGGDRFANLVQWLAMLGSLVGVSLIAEQLGARRPGQILSAVVCATTPMGILQASGAQNNWVVSFWLVCLAYHLLSLISQPNSTTEAAWAGASLGLAILTKGTAYLIALPFVVWTVIAAWSRGDGRWRAPAIIGLAVLAINAGHYTRNVRVWGSPLGPGGEGPFVYANESFGPLQLVSNVVRNLALHLRTPDDRVNRLIEAEIRRFHRFLQVDIDDPKTTWFDTTFHLPPRGSSLDEDSAGNPVHAALIAMSCFMLVATPSLRRHRALLLYAAVLVVAFLVFALYLRWQPWHSRLHLPLFVLWSSVLGVVWERHRRLALSVSGVLLVLALPSVVDNRSRPLLGHEAVFWHSRANQYLTTRPELREPYNAALRQINEAGCSNIGLWIEVDAAEYPMWVLAGHEAGAGRVHIEHIYVKNASVRAPLSSELDTFDPCAILLVASHPSIPTTFPFKGRSYNITLKAPPVNLFTRE